MEFNWEILEKKWLYYEFIWLKNFQDTKVNKLSKPNFEKKKISQKTFAFLFLLNNLERVVTKKELTEEYTRLTNKNTNDFQAARHLGNDGYDVQNHDYGIKGYKLVSLKPRSDFFNHRSKTITDGEIITNELFEELKLEYGYRCVVCTSDEGQKSRKIKSNSIVKLEKGHCDPRKPLSIDNCIPICQYCNGIYQNYAIFDKFGNITNWLKK